MLHKEQLTERQTEQMIAGFMFQLQNKGYLIFSQKPNMTANKH